MAKSKRFHKKANYEGKSHRIFDDVIDVASTLFRNRKEAGAERLRLLAESTRDYAASMTDLPTLQRQAQLASENIGNFAEYVLNTDIKHMVNDAAVLARRRPLFTLGVAAAAGLAATRWVATSAMATAPTVRRRSKKATKLNGVGRGAMNASGHAHA